MTGLCVITRNGCNFCLYQHKAAKLMKTKNAILILVRIFLDIGITSMAIS